MTITQPPEADSHATGPVSSELLSSVPVPADAEVREALERGAVGDAFRAAVSADDLDIAVDVLRIGWFDLIKDSHRNRLRETLERLSAAELTSRPLLAMALGLAYNGDGFRRAKAAYYFGLAATGVRRNRHRISPAERALVLASESAALRLLGKTSSSVASAQAGLRALDDIREERSSLIGYLPRVFAQLGMSLYYGGQESEALHVFTRGYAEAGPSDLSSFGNLSMVAGIHALAGNLKEARQHVLLARGEPWTDEQRSMYPGTFYRLAEAILALERFDVEKTRTHLSAMRHDRRTIEHWVAIAHVEALTSLLEGNPSDGLAALDELVVLRGAEGTARSARESLSSIRSLLHIALGNYDAAAAVLRSDAGRTPQAHVDRARLALATGRSSDALKELRAIAGHAQSSRTQAEALSVEAAVGLRTGSGRRTSAVLQQLTAVLRRSGQRIAPQLLPQPDFDAIIVAMERSGASDLFERRAQRPLVPAPERPVLTPRELAVLHALARTSSLSEIAVELYVSTNTVKTHLKSLYRKLGARNREEALTIALHGHLISVAGDRRAAGSD